MSSEPNFIPIYTIINEYENDFFPSDLSDEKDPYRYDGYDVPVLIESDYFGGFASYN